MTARRLAPWCLVAACLAAAPPRAPAQEKGDDSAALQFRLYGSVLPGYSRAEAVAASQPMLALLGKKVGVRIQCAVHDGTTPKDLFDFGKKLDSGEYHLAAVWGMEYGWLHEKYPRIRALGAVYNGDPKNSSGTLVLVAKGSPFKKLADLKDRRLAVSRDLPLMDRLFLREMLLAEKLEPKGFFERSEPYPTARQAAAAVKNGKADCLVMSTTSYTCLADLQPGVARGLVELTSGEMYPMAALVGCPEAVDRFGKRKGLWDDLRDQLLEVHKSTEGKECVSFWRFQHFVKAGDDYQRQVDDMTKKYSSKKLLNLE